MRDSERGEFCGNSMVNFIPNSLSVISHQSSVIIDNHTFRQVLLPSTAIPFPLDCHSREVFHQNTQLLLLTPFHEFV